MSPRTNSFAWAGTRAHKPHIIIVCCICLAGIFLLLFWDLVYDNSSLAIAWVHKHSQIEQQVQSFDFKDTDSERQCLSGGNRQASQLDQVPKVVHFLWALKPSGANLDFLGYLAIRAALTSLQPASVKLHHSYLNENEDNTYWHKLKDNVTLVRHGPPPGRMNVAHKADILRLDILKKEGGIYMDADSYALRPFDDLLNSSKDVVLGHEGGNRWGLCNAIIIARKGAAFLDRWIEHYSDFNSGKEWNFHSVILPKQLASENSAEVCTLSPTVFFWPTWTYEHIRFMHEELSADEAAQVQSTLDRLGGVLYPDQLAYHAWHQMAAPRVRGLTPHKVRTVNTRFNMLVRRFLEP